MKGLKLSICVFAAILMVASVGLAQEKGYSNADRSNVQGGQPNELCADAIALPVPSLTAGSTVAAVSDVIGGFCGTSPSTAGVWYRVLGTGNTMTAGFCNDGGTADYDSKINVYCDGCAVQTCVGGNDDFCPGFLSQVSWCTQAGFQYLVYVSGFGTAEGNFDLAITDDGVACPDPGTCTEVPVEMMDFTVTDQ